MNGRHCHCCCLLRMMSRDDTMKRDTNSNNNNGSNKKRRERTALSTGLIRCLLFGVFSDVRAVCVVYAIHGFNSLRIKFMKSRTETREARTRTTVVLEAHRFVFPLFSIFLIIIIIIYHLCGSAWGRRGAYCIVSICVGPEPEKYNTRVATWDNKL